MIGNRASEASSCDKPSATVIDLLGSPAYLQTNRTRPASVRKDMHTGRVFCFQLLDHTRPAA